MSEIVVVRGKVDDGTKIYGPGDVVPGLSAKDQEDLVEAGYCQWQDEPADVQEETIGGENDSDNSPPPGDDDQKDPPQDEDDGGEGGPDTSVPVADEPKKRK